LPIDPVSARTTVSFAISGTIEKSTVLNYNHGRLKVIECVVVLKGNQQSLANIGHKLHAEP
jgi:hypothetical protein